MTIGYNGNTSQDHKNHRKILLNLTDYIKPIMGFHLLKQNKGICAGVFYGLFIHVLPLEIQLSTGDG